MPEGQALWLVSLAIAVAVLLVATILLTVVLRTAGRIDDGARQIWSVGKNVANCTVQLSLLGRTNQLVEDVLHSATAILENTRRIQSHAQGCPGCPACVIEGEAETHRTFRGALGGPG